MAKWKESSLGLRFVKMTAQALILPRSR